jgi:hypothetical protein
LEIEPQFIGEKAARNFAIGIVGMPLCRDKWHNVAHESLIIILLEKRNPGLAQLTGFWVPRKLFRFKFQ